MHLAEAISNHLVCPNECVSPQGSVEAQCGLVLNGQGGVIRRGKPPLPNPPFIVCRCTGGRERSQPDTTRHRQTNGRNTALLSAVNTLEQERPYVFFLLFLLAYLNAVTRFRYKKKNGLSVNTHDLKKNMSPQTFVFQFSLRETN